MKLITKRCGGTEYERKNTPGETKIMCEEGRGIIKRLMKLEESGMRYKW